MNNLGSGNLDHGQKRYREHAFDTSVQGWQRHFGGLEGHDCFWLLAECVTRV
jgi:hypothetical protein